MHGRDGRAWTVRESLQGAKEMDEGGRRGESCRRGRMGRMRGKRRRTGGS